MNNETKDIDKPKFSGIYGIRNRNLLTMSLQTRYRNKRVNVSDSQMNA